MIINFIYGKFILSLCELDNNCIGCIFTGANKPSEIETTRVFSSQTLNARYREQNYTHLSRPFTTESRALKP